MSVLRRTLVVGGIAVLGLSCAEGAPAPMAVLPMSAVPVAEVQLATAKSGNVIWVNGPGNKGRIEACDGGTYEYNVAAGNTRDGYRPAVGDKVDFTAGPGKVARDVAPRADQDNSACLAACDEARGDAVATCEATFDATTACSARDTACQAEVTEVRTACVANAETVSNSCKGNCQ